MTPSIRRYIFTNSRAQRGLSLIELMISITIGLLILVALTTLFVNQSHTRSELDKSTRMIENGRYSMELLSDNLRLAGFFGAFVPSNLLDISDPEHPTIPGGIKDPCSLTLADMEAMLPMHVGGYDAAGVNASITTPPCGLVDLRNGSDILVLRHAETTTPLAQAAAVNGVHYIQVSTCAFDGAKHVLSNTPANFNRRERSCTPTSTAPYAPLRQLIVQTYFISPDNNPGDGIPTLKVRELDPAGTGLFVTTPLVEGVEYMQVEYGIDGVDTDADGMPDRFKPGVPDVTPSDTDGAPDAYSTCSPCSISQWANVVAVKLYIISRNIEPSTGYTDNKTYTLGQAGAFGPFNDRYKRHVYTQVVRLINPSSRKELQ